MSLDLIPTVGNVLKRPLFLKARLVAGKEGLNRRIRWVHILQVSHVESLVSGNEMILSTGVGLQQGAEVDFLQQLIDHGVSCLCIELGYYFKDISELMIRMADRHRFPLIVFDETVRFIDLTQDIHSMIINSHHETLEKLEKISRQFHRLSLTSQATVQILRLLHINRQAKIVFLPSDGNAHFIPQTDGKEQERLKKAVSRHVSSCSSSTAENAHTTWTEGNCSYILYPVGALGQTWGHLLMIMEEREPEELDYLVLDSGAIAIAQDLLRKRYLEERKLHTEHIWVDDLIHDRIRDQEQIWHWLPSRFKQQVRSYRVCLLEIKEGGKDEALFSENDWETFRIHLMLLIRNLFTTSGFHPLITAKYNRLVVVAVDLDNDTTQRERIQQVFTSASSAAAGESLQIGGLHFGVGRKYEQLNHASQSYQEALSVLKINQTFRLHTGPFYENLGVYRLLMQPGNEPALESFVQDTLGPLIEHDRVHHGELLPTLQALLDHDGSKQAAAQQLFIVRQTMYHRLNKIKELLGDDFMDTERRLSIEVALRALHISGPIPAGRASLAHKKGTVPKAK